ncbi:MAG: cation transporter [Cyclobacteriaceae bacterium]
MNKSTFHITRMDCASEEQLIRMKLEGDIAIYSLSFNIPERELVVFHDHSSQTVAQKVNELNLGSTLLESVEVETSGDVDTTTQHKLLWTVLAINFGCFVLEIVTGFTSRSMGLVADSLDMLAYAFVYGLALFVVGGTAIRKKSIATAAGYLQMVLAIVGFTEALRRFMGYDLAPDFGTMIVISIIALSGNAICLWLLQRSKSTEPHMKASMIFTSNDVIINIGVIAAGVMVYITGSNKPDLIVGSIIFFIVTRGALRILKLGN